MLIPPGGIIGLLGGGQLGRMLALAAAPLGYRVHVYAPEAELPAADVSFATTRAPYDDEVALAAFAEAVDVITFEFENVPAETVASLEARCLVHPGPVALRIAQDRMDEKAFVEALGGRPAPYAAVETLADLERALDGFGVPAILKTRRLGYDGKGQVLIDTPAQARDAFASLGGTSLVLEAFVAFEAEFSIIVARSSDGRARVYPATETRHADGILRDCVVPVGPACAAHVDEATDLALRIAAALDYTGVLACEFFAGSDGPVFNEMAPRVHNSGHWTIEGAVTSQFEQHVRAICGLPLGATDLVGSGITLRNLLGRDADGWAEILAHPDAHLHLYGKSIPAIRRKMGHVTTVRR